MHAIFKHTALLGYSAFDHFSAHTHIYSLLIWDMLTYTIRITVNLTRAVCKEELIHLIERWFGWNYYYSDFTEYTLDKLTNNFTKCFYFESSFTSNIKLKTTIYLICLMLFYSSYITFEYYEHQTKVKRCIND